MFTLLAMLVVSIPIWFRGDVYTYLSSVATSKLLLHETTMSNLQKVGDNAYSVYQLQINNKGKLEGSPMVMLEHLYCELGSSEDELLGLNFIECNYGDIYLLMGEDNKTNVTELPIDMPPYLLMNNIRLHVNTIEQKPEETLVVILDGFFKLDSDGNVDDLSFRLTTVDGKLLVRVEKNPNYNPDSILPKSMLPYVLKDFSIFNIMKYKDAGKIIKYWPALQSLLEFIKK